MSVGFAPMEFLYRLMYLCFIGCDLALACMLLLAIRRWKAHYLWLPGLGFLVGTFSIAILAWVGAAVWGAIWLIGEIWKGVTWILSSIVTWLAPFGFVIGITIGLLIVIALLVWIFKEFGAKGLHFKAKGILELTLSVALLIVIVLFARFLLQIVLLPFLHWLGILLHPLLHFLGLVFGWIIRIVGCLIAGVLCLLLAIGLIGSIGRLAIDQIRAAWVCGECVRGATLALFSFGTALSIILLFSAGAVEPELTPAPTSQVIVANRRPLNSTRKHLQKHRKAAALPTTTIPTPLHPMHMAESIDRAWSASYIPLGISSPTSVMNAILPSPASAWAQQTFRTASAPIFDALLLLLAVTIGLVGIIRGLFLREEREPHISFYKNDLIGFVALPLGVAIAVVANSIHSEN